MPNELKPCPFCGGTAKFISFSEIRSYRPACLVKCDDCGASVREFVSEDNTFSYKDEAANAWNRRANDEQAY